MLFQPVLPVTIVLAVFASTSMVNATEFSGDASEGSVLPITNNFQIGDKLDPAHGDRGATFNLFVPHFKPSNELGELEAPTSCNPLVTIVPLPSDSKEDDVISVWTYPKDLVRVTDAGSGIVYFGWNADVLLTNYDHHYRPQVEIRVPEQQLRSLTTCVDTVIEPGFTKLEDLLIKDSMVQGDLTELDTRSHKLKISASGPETQVSISLHQHEEDEAAAPAAEQPKSEDSNGRPVAVSLSVNSGAKAHIQGDLQSVRASGEGSMVIHNGKLALFQTKDGSSSLVQAGAQFETTSSVNNPCKIVVSVAGGGKCRDSVEESYIEEATRVYKNRRSAVYCKAVGRSILAGGEEHSQAATATTSENHKKRFLRH